MSDFFRKLRENFLGESPKEEEPREEYEKKGFVLPFSFPGELGTAPQTLGPFIFSPRGRELSPEERYHEGFHARSFGIPALFSNREEEEKAAYEEESKQFPNINNPYKPQLASEDETELAKQKQRDFFKKQSEIQARAMR